MATATLPETALPKLSNEEISRYSRHLILPEVGMEGQQKLKAAKVLCVGTGGLGAPLALYLAAAGVGTLGLVDFDTVDLTEVGSGLIDWKKIFAQSGKAGIKHYIVEHDHPKQPFDSIAKSYDYLSKVSF